VTGYENALHTQIDPSRREIWQRNTPILFAFINIGLEREAIDPIVLTEIPFVILPVMLICNIGVELKERRQKSRNTVGRSGCEWGRRDKIRHLGEGDSSRRAIIKQYRVREVRRVIGGEGRRKREGDIHDGPRAEHIRDRVHALDAGAGRVLFLEMGIVVTKQVDE